MSDSRLEKFIYAICSMDVSDLPVPLSRIEKLWNCLITGDTPDFEPLSRNEKYLMAMLDRYDINNLPAPMSRSEKLLYKIAVGETDLSDVPGYLSRYEELLKYLIENGALSDFEYVLYTLNQSLSTLYTTAEKPVKSAILSGQTLVNLVNQSTSDIITIGNNSSLDISLRFNVKNLTTYTAIFNVITLESPDDSWCGFIINDGWCSNSMPYKIGINKIKFTTHENSNCKRFRLRGINNTFKNLIVLEGDYTNVDIPYFEDMQSVKMPVLTTTGKNLFNFDDLELGTLSLSNGELVSSDNVRRNKSFISVDCSKNFSFSMPNYSKSEGARYVLIHCYNINKEYIRYIVLGDNLAKYENRPFLEGTKFVKFTIQQVEQTNPTDVFEVQFEYGKVSTTYEPYKSNILTVNEDVTLRGIGEVQDTLNCLTGEVTQRVYELVLDGSENWRVTSQTFQPTDSNFINFDLGVNSIKRGTDIICNNIPVRDWRESSTELKSRSIATHSSNSILRLCIEKSIASDVVTLKQYLQSNNSKVYYQPTTESIKTVDLTIQDQDNQPTKLGTFENVTHVSLESAGLIPEVEMEVATHISKELASASPLMDDISTNQQQLESTVDEQSNNIDATMIATTEIYEETL